MTQRRHYDVYVCDVCGSITDTHGEPVGCVNTACSQPGMRPTVVVEAIVLADAIELADEGWGYVHGHFRRKADYEPRIASLREVLDG